MAVGRSHKFAARFLFSCHNSHRRRDWRSSSLIGRYLYSSLRVGPECLLVVRKEKEKNYMNAFTPLLLHALRLLIYILIL
jgi:hypothetical protein